MVNRQVLCRSLAALVLTRRCWIAFGLSLCTVPAMAQAFRVQ